jgi:hypothetical protein
MSRNLKNFLIRLGALGAAACSSVYAANSAPNHTAVIARPQPIARSPYGVELVAEDGNILHAYQRGGRYYVLGRHGDRYSIRVRNPTGRRVEAVISVDGLDVVDGETADFRTKRGYLVPAYGEVVVDGFRTSTTEVAAFRFSSVASSYADRKGKGRNVGVIGVAIFEERAEPEQQVIVPEPTYGRDDEDRPYYGDGRGATTGARHAQADATAKAAPPPRVGGAGGGGKAPAAANGGPAPSATPSAPQAAQGRTRTAMRDSDEGGMREETGEACCSERRSRPGLGTEWGEQRYSAVDFTRFVRASSTVPSAIAELRYNDASGLRALGIRLEPEPDQDELMRRETADPFPGSFAAPPP